MDGLLGTLLGAVLAPALFGAGLVRWLGLTPATSWRVFAAWSYLVGHFALAWPTFAWVQAGRPFAGWLLPAGAAALGGALWWWQRERAPAAATPAVAPRRDAWLRGAWIALSVSLLERASARSAHAVLSADEAHIWNAKARVLWAGGDLHAWFAAAYAHHADYPMWNPLVQVLAFASCDRPLLWECRVPVQMFALALVALLSVAIGRHLPRWPAIAVLVAFGTVASFVETAPTAYADILVAFALVATVDAWLRFRAGGERVWWRLGCVALAALLASKNEGTMLTLVVVAAGVASRCLDRRPWPRVGREVVWLLVPVVTVAAGRWFNAVYGLANDMTGPDGAGRGLLERLWFWLPERLGTVGARFAGLVVSGRETRWLVLAMLLAPLVAGRAALRSERAWPWLIVVFGLAGYALVFVSTPIDQGGPDGAANGLRYHLDTAASRTVLHLLPTAALALAACLAALRTGGDGDGAASPSREPVALR